jgi:hypothetical protein
MLCGSYDPGYNFLLELTQVVLLYFFLY